MTLSDLWKKAQDFIGGAGNEIQQHVVQPVEREVQQITPQFHNLVQRVESFGNVSGNTITGIPQATNQYFNGLVNNQQNIIPYFNTSKDTNLAETIGKKIANFGSGIINNVATEGIIKPTYDLAGGIGALAYGNPINRDTFKSGAFKVGTDLVGGGNNLQNTLGDVGQTVQPILNAWGGGKAEELFGSDAFKSLLKGEGGVLAQKDALKMVAQYSGKTGAKIGGLFGLSQGLMDNKDKSLSEDLLNSTISGVAGAMAGYGLGYATPYAGKEAGSLVKDLRAKLSPGITKTIKANINGVMMSLPELEDHLTQVSKENYAGQYSPQKVAEWAQSLFDKAEKTVVQSVAPYRSESVIGRTLDKTPVGLSIKDVSKDSLQEGGKKTLASSPLIQEARKGLENIKQGQPLINKNNPLEKSTFWKVGNIFKSPTSNEKIPAAFINYQTKVGNKIVEDVRYVPLENFAKEYSTADGKDVSKMISEIRSVRKSNTSLLQNTTPQEKSIVDKYAKSQPLQEGGMSKADHFFGPEENANRQISYITEAEKDKANMTDAEIAAKEQDRKMGIIQRGIENAQAKPERPTGFKTTEPKKSPLLKIIGNTEQQKVQGAIVNHERVANEIRSYGQDAYLAGKKIPKAEFTAIRDKYQAGTPIDQIANESSKPTQVRDYLTKVKKYYANELALDRASGGATNEEANHLVQKWDLTNPEDMERYNELASQRGLQKYKGYGAQPKVFRTYAEGEAKGFHPLNSNINEDLLQHSNGAATVISRQALKQGLMEAAPKKVSINGMGLTPERKPFVNSNIPGLEGMSFHPDVNERLKGFQPKTGKDFIKIAKEKAAMAGDTNFYKYLPQSSKEAGFSGVVGKLYDSVNQPMKHFLLNFAGFHSINVSANYAGASMNHPVKGVKGLLQSVPAFFSENYTQKVIQGFKEKMIPGLDMSVHDAGLRAGVNMGRNLPAEGASRLNILNASTRAIFDRELHVLKLNLVDQVFGSGKIDPSSPKGIALGKEINAIMGEINTRTMNINPNSMKWASRILLAPQFTVSKYKVIGDAALKGGEKGGNLARQAVVGKSLVMGSLASLGTLLATGKFPSLKQVLLNYTIAPETQTNMTNAKGQKLSIGYPQTFVTEPIGAVQDPGHYAEARFSPALSDSIALYTNKDYYGNPIINPDKSQPVLSQAFKGVVLGDLPIGVQQMVKAINGEQSGAATALNIAGLKVKVNSDDPANAFWDRYDQNKSVFDRYIALSPQDRVSFYNQNKGEMQQYSQQQKISAAYMKLKNSGDVVGANKLVGDASKLLGGGEIKSDGTFFSTLSLYAKAIGTDPMTAFHDIFSGQSIQKLNNGAIIVNRMDLPTSTTIKNKLVSAQGGKAQDYELDHTIPLSLGGTNEESNLKLVPASEAKQQDVVETYLYNQLSSGTMNKDVAQKQMADYKNGKITLAQATQGQGKAVSNAISLTSPTSQPKMSAPELALARMDFENSDKNFDQQGGYTFRKNPDGTTSIITNDSYNSQLLEAQMSGQKMNKDLKGWVQSAMKQVKTFQTQLNDPTTDGLDKVKIQNQMNTRIAELQKYMGYGGFTKPKAGKKAKVLKLPKATKSTFKPTFNKTQTPKLTSPKVKITALKLPTIKAIKPRKPNLAKITYKKSVSTLPGAKRLA